MASPTSRVSDVDLSPRGHAVAIPTRLVPVAKAVVFAGGALVVVAVTPGTGGLHDLASWWADPIAVQKFVVWTVLWGLVGLGGGSLPLTARPAPGVGGITHWLRPGTIRMPPWPGRVLCTSGTRRSVVDVALYVAALALGVALLVSGGVHVGADPTLSRTRVWALLLCLAALGVRDRTPLLAARPELYGPMLVVFMFPVGSMVFALKLCLAALWWTAAAGTADRYFPFVVATLATRAPWRRAPFLRATLWRSWPDDLRPSATGRVAAWTWTAVGVAVPLVLLVSRGGPVTVAAVTLMLLVQLATSLPQQWNLVLLYLTVVLFGHYAAVGASTLHPAPLVAVLVLLLVVPPVRAALRPRAVSSTATLRGAAGNSATSLWLVRRGAPAAALDSVLGPTADDDAAPDVPAVDELLPGHRALDGLLPRAVDDVTAYLRLDGESVAARALGWSGGDGHLHGEQLFDAVQERAGFAAGELRLITLEAPPLLRGTQAYTIVDAADGWVEAGTVRVTDVVARQPRRPGGNADAVTIPVELTFQVLPRLTPEIIRPVRPRPRPRPRPGPRSVASSRPPAATESR